MPEADRRRGDSPQRAGENKLFVGGVSHKFRDHDLKQGVITTRSTRIAYGVAPDCTNF